MGGPYFSKKALKWGWIVDEAPLGMGSYGSVYKVEIPSNAEWYPDDVIPGTKYAIKASLVVKGERTETIANKEVEMLEQFIHPNVVTCWHSWTEKYKRKKHKIKAHDKKTMRSATHVQYILMECLPYTLLDYIDKRRTNPEGYPLDLKGAIKILLDIGRGVQILHEDGCGHRDLKPNNICLRTTPKEKATFIAILIDFGYCRVADDVSQKAKYLRDDMSDFGIMCLFILESVVHPNRIEKTYGTEKELKDRIRLTVRALSERYGYPKSFHDQWTSKLQSMILPSPLRPKGSSKERLEISNVVEFFEDYLHLVQGSSPTGKCYRKDSRRTKLRLSTGKSETGLSGIRTLRAGAETFHRARRHGPLTCCWKIS